MRSIARHPRFCDRSIEGCLGDESTAYPSPFPLPRLERASRHARTSKSGPLCRSPKGAVWKVAEVRKSGVDTYTVTWDAPSLITKVPNMAADLLRQAVRRRTRDPEGQDLPADLLQRARDAISPREIIRRWRERNYFP